MLYVLYRSNLPGLSYREGQAEIVHLEADLHAVIEWADARGMRWAISRTNAAGRFAEFLLHGALPTNLIERIGVPSEEVRREVASSLKGASRPSVEIRGEWYF